MPETIELRVTSFAVAEELMEMYYGYQILENGEVTMERVMTRSGEAMGEALKGINESIVAQANQMVAAGQPIEIDVYATIKGALRVAIIEELGLAIE